jgi:hypothetical protein
MPTSTHEIAAQVWNLALYDRTADLSEIRRAIEEIEAERVKRALKAIAELEATKSEHRGRRFVVAWKARNGALRVTQGIAYIEKRDDAKSLPGQSTDDSEQHGNLGYGVLVDDYNAPFPVRYRSMADFREWLEGGEIPYSIVYLD